MSHEYLLPFDQLQQMDDLSGAALYRAEVKRIPFIPRDEQPAYIEAARSNDETAQHELVLNCLNWTMRHAAAICRDYPPEHSDMMDLVGHANLKMVEAMPKALTVDDPVAYFMSVGAHEMYRYCRYSDPLIKRQRGISPDAPHPGTVSLEARNVPLAAPEAPTELPEAYRIVYDALAKLAPRHRTVLAAAYGLDGETRHSNTDIAAMLDLPKGTVEKYLWQAKRSLAIKLAPYIGELGLREA